ncbi:MAG: hypothetical protein IJ097_03260 [Bacilli bacterium]|nr:hypothetical protein [Bacilli bacterium]
MRILTKRKVADTAKVLIAISITLLVYGIILNYVNKQQSLNPVVVEKTTEDENVVLITTSDGTEIVPGNIIKNIKDNESNRVVNNKKISTHTNELDNINSKLRNEIENKYGVEVLYGKETENYTVGGVSTTELTDSNLTNKRLNELNCVLGLYPNGLFKEIKNGGIPLTIILVNNYSENSITGVTDSSYDYADISIAAIYPFAESFYHESYHYIERYMFKLGASFSSWDKYNPKDFTWGTIDGSLSYSNTFKENAYFVNNYAQTMETEDRASTFEYMMANTKASCLNKNTTIWNKATYMAEMMRFTLDSVSDIPEGEVYWEELLVNENRKMMGCNI